MFSSFVVPFPSPPQQPTLTAAGEQDDYLPCDAGGRLLFARNRRDCDEYWAALAEKAYAKLCGCYAALEAGSEADALVDLTGGVAFTVDLRSAELAGAATVAARLDAVQRGRGRYLVGCARGSRSRGAWQGIVPGHAYQVVRVVRAVPLATGATVDAASAAMRPRHGSTRRRCAHARHGPGRRPLTLNA